MTFLRKSAILCPGHTTLCLCTWALLPWLIHSSLEWDLENHWMCCSTVPVYTWRQWHLISPWFDTVLDGRNEKEVLFFLLSGEQIELSLACCHNRVHRWDNALTCEERLVIRSDMRNVLVWRCSSNAFVFHDPSFQCGVFCHLGRVTEKEGEGTGKDTLTALRSSLLWILWAEVLCKSLPAEPNPEREELSATAYQSSCFTLGQLFLRSSWNDHKEATIHHDPAGKT